MLSISDTTLGAPLEIMNMQSQGHYAHLIPFDRESQDIEKMIPHELLEHFQILAELSSPFV